MNSDERYQLLNLFYRSKRGLPLTQDEKQLCQTLFERNPVEYAVVQAEGAKRAVDELKNLGRRK